jgi:hypothetical protein
MKRSNSIRASPLLEPIFTRSNPSPKTSHHAPAWFTTPPTSKSKGPGKAPGKHPRGLPWLTAWITTEDQGHNLQRHRWSFGRCPVRDALLNSLGPGLKCLCGAGLPMFYRGVNPVSAAVSSSHTGGPGVQKALQQPVFVSLVFDSKEHRPPVCRRLFHGPFPTFIHFPTPFVLVNQGLATSFSVPLEVRTGALVCGQWLLQRSGGAHGARTGVAGGGQVQALPGCPQADPGCDPRDRLPSNGVVGGSGS